MLNHAKNTNSDFKMLISPRCLTNLVKCGPTNRNFRSVILSFVDVFERQAVTSLRVP